MARMHLLTVGDTNSFFWTTETTAFLGNTLLKAMLSDNVMVYENVLYKHN